MAKLAIKPGSTSVSLYVLIQDSSSLTGAGLAGLAYWSSGLLCHYVRSRGSATQILLAGGINSTSAWLERGFTAVDDTNMPGIYRLDIPNAVCAAGARSAVIMLKGATNMAPVVLEIDLSNDANVEHWKGAAAQAMTGDAYAAIVAMRGADNDTLKTLSDQLDALPTSTTDAMLLRDWEAVTGTVPDRSTLNALRFLRNKWAASGGTLSVYEEDDATVAWEALLTTNAGADRITGSTPE